MSETTVQFKSFVGVDLHKCTVTLRAVAASGELIASTKIDTKCINRIHQWLLELPRPVWMAVEASPFIEWFIDRYRDCVDRIDIADATELANRRGKRRKTDRNDALDIAVRLARGDCPLGWIADEHTARLRKLGRHWHQLSRTLSRTKHCMKSIFHAANVRGPKLTSSTAQKWLLARGHLLKDGYYDAFANFIDLLSIIERQRDQLRRRIVLANRSEHFNDLTCLIKTVSGINDIWACIITAEIGDFNRFPNAETIEFWAGLTPDNTESAGRDRSGHITKAGSKTLRWALGKAAMCLVRSDGKFAKVKERTLRKCGNKKPKANVAMARRLLKILYAMVRDGTVYQNTAPTKHQEKANRVRLKKTKRVA